LLNGRSPALPKIINTCYSFVSQKEAIRVSSVHEWDGKTLTPVKGAGGGQLHLVETVALGNRCAVHLLRAGHQQVLVGVDGSGLKTVVALPPIFDTSLSEAQSAETCVADSKLEPALHVAV